MPFVVKGPQIGPPSATHTAEDPALQERALQGPSSQDLASQAPASRDLGGGQALTVGLVDEGLKALLRRFIAKRPMVNQIQLHWIETDLNRMMNDAFAKDLWKLIQEHRPKNIDISEAVNDPGAPHSHVSLQSLEKGLKVSLYSRDGATQFFKQCEIGATEAEAFLYEIENLIGGRIFQPLLKYLPIGS